MSLINAINSVDSFYRNFSLGIREVKEEIGAAYDLAKMGLANPNQSKFNAISSAFSNLSLKSKLTLGTFSAAGIGLAAWGISELLDEEEETVIRQIQ